MWYTTRYEGFDNNYKSQTARSNILANDSSMINHLFMDLLRTSVLLKVISITGLMLTYYLYKGTGFFTYNLEFTTEDQRMSGGFRAGLALFSGLYLVGSVYMLLFQAFLSDDACWARGYRSGAKWLNNATFYDVVSATIQFILFIYMLNDYNRVWWRHFNSGGAEWSFAIFARFLNAFSCLYYANAFFLLEVYHDTGTNDWHGVLNWFLFTVTGAAEINSIWFGNAALAIILHWIANISCLVWAMAFEQEMNLSAPGLNESELTNDIEAQVEKYTKINPYQNLSN